MSKKTHIMLGAAVFIVLAGITATVAKSLLPKTSVAALTFAECESSTDIPLEFDLNQTVKLNVQSDKDAEFTVENYAINNKPIKAGEVASFTFKTVRSGIFDAKVTGCEEHASIKIRDVNGLLPTTEDHAKTDDDHKQEATNSDATEEETDQHRETEASGENIE